MRANLLRNIPFVLEVMRIEALRSVQTHSFFGSFLQDAGYNVFSSQVYISEKYDSRFLLDNLNPLW